MDEPITPDNTRVVRIMDDFHQFVRSADQQRRGIPFNMITEGETHSYGKRSFSSSSEALNRAKFAEMESRHVSDERAHKIARLDLESRNEKLISENRLLKEKCDGLQLKVKQVTMQAITAQDKFQELRNSRMRDKESLEEMLIESQKDKEASERDLQLNIDHLRNSNDELKQRNTHLSMQNNALREKLEETAALLNHKTSRVQKLTEDLKESGNNEPKLREYQLKIQDLELRLSRSSEAEQMAKILKDDLERLRILEIEVVKLRERNEIYKENETNVLLMKEKLLSAETKLSHNEKLIEKAALTELENKDLIAQLNEAKKKEILPVTDLLAEVKKLQQKEAVAACDKGQIHAELLTCRIKCEGMQNNISNLEKTIEEKNEANRTKDTQIRHLQKRALLLTGERNSLRSILQSYDSELSTTAHTDQLILRAQNAETANQKVHTRLVDVEKEALNNATLASHLKVTIKEMENNIKQLERKLEEGSGSKAGEKEMENLRQKVEDLEKERSRLQKEKEHLELWAEQNKMRGDYDPSKVKVFHLKMNPADMAHKQSALEVSKLRAKCLKLEEKIHKLESNQDVTTTNIDVTQGKDFQEKLAASELKNQRLKEVFSKRIFEFRQACYTLTGFRIDSTADNQYKLVSMYAENEEDHLLFKSDSSGVMHLLETNFSTSLDNLIKLHLHHQNSIPMFLSSITADLFSQQTMV
uniref:mitotic spindle assembly checkpoint protein MAD1-like n=1 Tax=Styela clava TaxID=7725 RepID=UPI00193A4E35|nr:mitotic spindle assembly checkpoint protein MAD1-like [Styela clava]